MESYSTKQLLLAVTFATLLVFGYSSFQYHRLALALRESQQHFSASTTEYREDIERLGTYAKSLEQEHDGLQDQLLGLEHENTDLATKILENDERSVVFENQIEALGGTVGTLEKLSKTDRELLQKYSKVYFLNEHYVPESLAPIDPQYLYDTQKALQIHSKVKAHLDQLLADAASSTEPLRVVSAYRSFGTQASLKSTYLVTYGRGANKFSAEQGYSEHQLGTTLDFTTPLLGAKFTKFATTTAYTWLLDRAYQYGFILSYPEHNTYYQYEPWHWRFVGVALAKKLHDNHQHFYDVDQREIDTYLVDIFD